jgi:hypothetical protein
MKDQDIEDEANEECPPPTDAEDEKMYRVTITPRYRIKEVPCLGWVEFKAIAEIFFGSKVLCRHKGPAFRTSRSDAVADAAWQAITSWVCSNKSQVQEEGSIQGLWGEEGYSQDGDGTPPGCDGGAEHSSTSRSV